VIQDVFMVLWSKRDRIAVNTSVSAFLYRAVRNRVLNILSHQKVISKYTESISRVMEEGCFLTDEKIREKELSRIIELEIEALPPKMRQIFLLNKEYGLSYKEIGEQLRISDKTAKLQVANAVRILRNRIPAFIAFCALFLAD
jgi:RNA polymerase sigma-70 factor (ECF subfamily)